MTDTIPAAARDTAVAKLNSIYSGQIPNSVAREIADAALEAAAPHLQPPTLPADLLDQLIDTGNKALNDYYHERACACSTWPNACATGGDYQFGLWDTDAFAIAMPAIIAAHEQTREQQ